jgi:hypothetical protein
MQVSDDVHTFGKACEHLLASVAIHRPLTEEEVLFVHPQDEPLDKVP